MVPLRLDVTRGDDIAAAARECRDAALLINNAGILRGARLLDAASLDAALLGFVRITTNRKVVSRPLAVADVMMRIQGWLELPHVHIAQPSETHFARLRVELERLETAGNLTTDAAHLAVLAMERGYVLCSTDTDFARFATLRWLNPCKG